MASGYDLDLHWLEDPPDDLKCLICLCVARNPRQHPGEGDNDCGKIFCQGCIAEYQNEHSTCPNCRQSLTVFKDAKSMFQTMYCKRNLNIILHMHFFLLVLKNELRYICVKPNELPTYLATG